VVARVACGSTSRQRVSAAAHNNACGSVRQRVAAACEVRRESEGRRWRGAKSSCFARGARTAAAARERTCSVTSYKSWRQLPARAWAGRGRQAQT
jgi:hypothetical protein